MWSDPRSSKTVYLADLQRFIFTAEYTPQLGPDGEHELRFKTSKCEISQSLTQDAAKLLLRCTRFHGGHRQSCTSASMMKPISIYIYTTQLTMITTPHEGTAMIMTLRFPNSVSACCQMFL